MSQVTSISTAVGDFLREFRSDHGFTLDQVARSAREFGASWSASSVKNIESGRAVTSLQNLISLTLALNNLAGTHLTLADVLGKAQAFESPRALGLPVRRAWVDKVLAGAPVEIGHVENLLGGEEKAKQIITDFPEKMKGWLKELPKGIDLQTIERVESQNRSASLAEERAARTLGIRPDSVRVWAIKLWGMDLEEKADKLARERLESLEEPSPQARGAMTRALIRQIREEVERNGSLA
ncbi:helix-turn-helix domain-containing protein [Leucobacter chromiiresistens]|nr:helix-turn-helix domain-containing protein [Leucobacter chromiiresistens]